MSEEAAAGATEADEATGAEGSEEAAGAAEAGVAEAGGEGEGEGEVAFVDSMLEAMTDGDIKSHQMWENLKGKSADELGRYVKELKSFSGKKGDIPKQDAPAEEWAEFYGKLGRPDSIDGYDFSLNDEFKEIVGADSVPFFEEAIGWFKESAFENGMPKDKADALIDGYLDLVATQTQFAQKSLEEINTENDKTLRSEWGTSYDGMMNGVKAMLRNNGMADEDISQAESAGVLTDPQLAIALGKISAKFDDDPEIGHHQTSTVSGLRDQLASVNMEVGEYISKGEKIPSHLKTKRIEIMNKMGDNL